MRESVQAVQSLRLPGCGCPTATTSRVSALIMTCMFTDVR
jgi:hypothetical protein